MLQEYFVQLGIILFPICVYQICAYTLSFDRYPANSWLLGIYGGITGILCQLMPLHIFGLEENFQCVPVILSILYGKRRAGVLSILILSAFQLYALSPPFRIPSITAILVYSAIPMLVCGRIGRFHLKKRILAANLLSAVTLLVQYMFLAVYFFLRFGGFKELMGYAGFLAVASAVQLFIMALGIFLLENINEVNRIRKRHESLVQYNPLGISTFDKEQRFVAVNAAYERITGYKESELLGRSRLMLWSDHQQAQRVLHSLLEGDIKQNVELSLRHKNGHPVPVRCTVVPIREENRMVGFFAMVSDITEEKKAEEALRSSEKLSAVGQLAAGVAHEIRNPLTSIKGFIQLLSRSASASQSDHYGIINSELSRIEGIISEMLVLAKPNVATFQPVRIKEKLEEVVSLAAGEANMQNVSIEAAFQEGSPVVIGEGNQLKQVFLNVIKNAIEAMPEGGSLRISLTYGQGRVRVTFTDTGLGIPEQVMDRVGEPFFTTKTTGTGLGLLVSNRIITNHNGIMEIESAVGQGTSITMSFPLGPGVHE